MAYSPPLSITPRLITLVSEISELIGHLALTRDGELAPQLRRAIASAPYRRHWPSRTTP
uniref:Uncharacterized protein n=1 Tax=Enterobacter cloacae TaxID=550 RepID=A0A219ZRS8_ENTCL|nr:hypothetical protein [Enterobacter cloacae]